MVLKKRFRRKKRNCRLFKIKTSGSGSSSSSSGSCKNIKSKEICKNKMLSKIKSTAVVQAAQNELLKSFRNHQELNDNIDEDSTQVSKTRELNINNNNIILEDNDSNDNNNNININNNNNNSNQLTYCKKNQDELLDIVEVSRKRRLSKDSADLLSNFIKWSFNLIKEQQHLPSLIKQENKNTIDNNQLNLLDDGDWQFNNNNRLFQLPEHLLLQRQRQRQHQHQPKLKSSSSLSGSSESSAINLALLSSTSQQKTFSHKTSPPAVLANSLLNVDSLKSNKRAKISETYSPEMQQHRAQLGSGGGGSLGALAAAAIAGGNNQRKSSSYLGNVVDRLHQSRQQQQQQQQLQQLQNQQNQIEEHEEEEEDEEEQDSNSNLGLSYHLQQFLQQQTSLEDLCNSVGLDDSNQLVLAAAIHKALVDSIGPNNNDNNNNNQQSLAELPSKSSLSSFSSFSSCSSSGGSGGSLNLNNNNNNNNNQPTNLSQKSSTCAINNNNNNNNLPVDVSINRHRRTYNTRAALNGATNSASRQINSNNTSSQSSSAAAAAAAAAAAINNLAGSRAQQQRHAQAAAALSALASAGNHNHNHNHNQNNSSTTNINVNNNNNNITTTPIVDFECDTCGSSFDDRHRLMQHQSIHLELKKDWFTETPVDEVMKIFNRRRGEFLCNTCNLRFEATFDYDKHNHSVHGQRPYCCQFCGNGTRTFRFWRQYLNHLYDHRYIFSCTIDDCDFTVNRRDSLRFHIFRFHLNCQLPQQQLTKVGFGMVHHQMLSNSNNNNNNNNTTTNNNNISCIDSKWAKISNLDDNEDIDDDMNVDQ